MNINGPWSKADENSLLAQVSETEAFKKLHAMMTEKLKGLQSYEINPEAIRAAVDKTVEEIANSRPEIKVLGSHQEGDLFIVDVEVPLHMAHLFR